MFSEQNPWIPQREPIICCWESDSVRGAYSNPFASLLPNVYEYSEKQMLQYARMLRRFGFTGVQLLDTCYSWARSGSIDAFHDKLRRMMRAAREAGLDVTLWIWAANFEGFGWRDPDVVYRPAAGYTARSDPRVRACFEKYYNCYAELAPLCDRLICHYFDPGELDEFEDVFFYMKLIEAKFREKNPDIRMGVDNWGAPEGYPQALAASGMTGYLLLEQSNPADWPENSRAEYRREVEKNGFCSGVWSWYTAEYEADQRAGMYVNAHILKERYLKVLEQTGDCLPTSYWAEIETTHLYDLFTVYCAAQLLIDPYRDADELLKEIAGLIWTGENAKKVCEALRLIEDVRSGYTWEEYWWTCDKFKSRRTGRAELVRAEKSCADIAALAADRSISSAELSLPFEPWVIAGLMLPHLEQIRLLCEFELGMERLEGLLAEGCSQHLLYHELKKLLRPIPDYNTWVGEFYQLERYRQYDMARDFCRRADIPMPKDPRRIYELRRVAVERLSTLQRGRSEPLLFNACDALASPYSCSQYEAIELLQMMIDEGLIEYAGDGRYRLVHWDERRFDFCPA